MFVYKLRRSHTKGQGKSYSECNELSPASAKSITKSGTVNAEKCFKEGDIDPQMAVRSGLLFLGGYVNTREKDGYICRLID
jgi:hypothetical protein